MIAAIVARLEAAAAFAAVEVAEDLDLILNGTAPEDGSVYVVPLRERAQSNTLATGGHRQLVETQFATAFVVREADDIRGAARAARFDSLKSAVETALTGWPPGPEADALSLVAGEGTSVPELGVSIYVQTWETARFLTGVFP